MLSEYEAQKLHDEIKRQHNLRFSRHDPVTRNRSGNSTRKPPAQWLVSALIVMAVSVAWIAILLAGLSGAHTASIAMASDQAAVSHCSGASQYSCGDSWRYG